MMLLCCSNYSFDDLIIVNFGGRSWMPLGNVTQIVEKGDLDNDSVIDTYSVTFDLYDYENNYRTASFKYVEDDGDLDFWDKTTVGNYSYSDQGRQTSSKIIYQELDNSGLVTYGYDQDTTLTNDGLPFMFTERKYGSSVGEDDYYTKYTSYDPLTGEFLVEASTDYSTGVPLTTYFTSDTINNERGHAIHYANNYTYPDGSTVNQTTNVLYEYDELGRLTYQSDQSTYDYLDDSLDYVEGRTFFWTYDSAGRVVQDTSEVTYDRSDLLSNSYETYNLYYYDDSGNLTNKNAYKGSFYDYDGVNPWQTLSKFFYEYDILGNLIYVDEIIDDDGVDDGYYPLEAIDNTHSYEYRYLTSDEYLAIDHPEDLALLV